MNLSCSSRMIKYLMFGFNLFFVISGIIIIGVGATARTVYTEYADFLDTKYFSLPNMLIATGVFIFVISFFGCCGAIKESWIMLGIFSVLLCIIFIFEFASGIAGYVLRDQTAAFLDTTLRSKLEIYNETYDVWDLIQRNFQCCGVDSYTDWNTVFKNYSLPISCCPDQGGTAGVFYCNSFVTTASPSITSTTTPVVVTSPTSPSTESSTQTSPTTSSESSSTSEVTTPKSSTSESSTSESSTSESSTSESSSDPSASSTTSLATTTATTNSTSPKPKRRRRNVKDSNDETTTSTPVTPDGPSTSSPYPTGCKEAFGDYIKKHAVQIGGCALGLAIVQILGIVFSCHLVRQLKNGYYST